jgi:hypothetical protein
LVAGGVFICTLIYLVLRLMGRHASLSPENKRNGLAMQMAFTLLLVAAATSIGLTDFIRHSGSALGTHYLQLALLYGMRHFRAGRGSDRRRAGPPPLSQDPFVLGGRIFQEQS